MSDFIKVFERIITQTKEKCLWKNGFYAYLIFSNLKL